MWQARFSEERGLSLKEQAEEGQLSASPQMEMPVLALRNEAGISLLDLLWVFLAVSTAFKLGRGAASPSEIPRGPADVLYGL
jgi:hypothetical protein